MTNLKFVLIPGLFSSPSIMYPIEDRLEKVYPDSEIEVMLSPGFKNVQDAKRQIGSFIRIMSSGDKNIVLVGHSAGGQLATHFIDNPKVMAVVTICAPSHDPRDYPLTVWPIQNLYTLQSLFNRMFCLKEKHRAKLFGGSLPEHMKSLSFGWFALQMSMGALLGNFTPKVRSLGKLLAFYSSGDPTILPKVVEKLASRYNGTTVGINCDHHYPLIEEGKLDLIIHQIQGHLSKFKND